MIRADEPQRAIRPMKERQSMAKYRHRVFEMYEFHDEATDALTPKSKVATAAKQPLACKLDHLSISRSASVEHVRFKSSQHFEEEAVETLRGDFSRLANALAQNSKVLVDFTGVRSFCLGSIKELMLFDRMLRIKGSRIALCGLDPTVRRSFFEEPVYEGRV